MTVRQERYLKLAAMFGILASIYLLDLPWPAHVFLAVVTCALAVDACRNLFDFRAERSRSRRPSHTPPSTLLGRFWVGFSHPIYRLVAATLGVSIAVSEDLFALSAFGAPVIYPDQYAALIVGSDDLAGSLIQPSYDLGPPALVTGLMFLNTFVWGSGIISVLVSWWRFVFNRGYRWFVLGFETSHAMPASAMPPHMQFRDHPVRRDHR
jgi:hypothetical protein